MHSLLQLVWLPARAFSECQQGSFLPSLLVKTSGMGWLREAFIGQSLTLDDAPGLSRRCREVGADRL